MKTSNTAERLRCVMNTRGLRQVDILKLTEPLAEQHGVHVRKNDLSQYLSGKTEPGQWKLYILAKALNVSETWLMGLDVPMDRTDEFIPNIEKRFISPSITDDTVTFPILGEIAAGYDKVAIEDWSGETIEIPRYFLHGRPQSDYFVLRIHGDSMYPQYQDNDVVLILKQTTLNRSGEIGAVLYEDENATLKKVEYVSGESWMELVPLNPQFKPIKIEGEALDHCRIIGIPKLLIREI